MKQKKIAVALTLCITASCIDRAYAYDLVPLWEMRNATVTDSFYTTYLDDVRVARDYNDFVLEGVAGWIACASDTLIGPNPNDTPYRGQTINGISYWDYYQNGLTQVPAHGYPTPWMNFACQQPPNSTKLYRLYKGSPATDHVYTTSDSEFNALEAAGYTFDRVEGYIFTNYLMGAPLYRYSLGANIPNHDVEHRYTMSSAAGSALSNAGWTYEGILGYVMPTYNNATINATGYTGTFNGASIAPTLSLNASIRNVVPPTGTFAVGGDGSANQYGNFASNVTVRPSGAVWQNMSFRFYTGDIFTSSSLDHIPFYLHYASSATQNDLSYLPPYDGIALVITKAGVASATGNCVGTSGGQLYIELGMAKAAGPTQDLLCDSNLATPLQNYTWYQISYSLDDNADVKISISQVGGAALTFAQGSTLFSKRFLNWYSCPTSPSVPSAAQTYCADPFSNDGFPVSNTGYVIHPLFNPPSDTTAAISQLTVNWLDANGNVLH
jgi:hypothetical protein